jgi:hypothetical protein
MGEQQQGGSGGHKVGFFGCLVFWVLAGFAYFWMRRTPAVMGAFASFEGWIGTMRNQSPWWLAAILGLAALSPAGLIWLLWKRYKRWREG